MCHIILYTVKLLVGFVYPTSCEQIMYSVMCRGCTKIEKKIVQIV